MHRINFSDFGVFPRKIWLKIYWKLTNDRLTKQVALVMVSAS
jgi:hypothetical protein